MAAANGVVTLTFAGQAVAAETVTIGSVVYTWRAAVAVTANEVLIGGTVAASAQNLADAVNRVAAQAGVTYGSATVVNPEVRASAVTATTVVLQARVAGVVGNRIPSTETMTQGSFGSATLISGTGSADDDIVNIINTMQPNAQIAQALREIAFDPASV